ncbi:MAG TPA: 3-methyl-2-oxobutanoate hydroxymethyltransferase [Fermentimonas caenicola]|jgi:3-methyl-2-oxobutanoate hydroxymethyltransferase|uniref:3-methyl-2-oxobutanoate hydroxymethyltransferase n=1 Tax=Lascolabacillus sp. TaxID=1924068 RepID=UPI0017BC6C70|nr:3-methyl-2-oxobutanoate hydroxymethyltransferase [Lascolabacillus sp.]MBP6174785.1 3-methyl-2-oxobutanoate hydroxymethyltransferase [Fermentimonas sp.]HHU41918.1 3-methyl-2-oxobutanoate hydroxymethyltransferase [Fermentimonas caenicola]MBP6197418.1 3-methyl-2-oxobutanoate hydroxymethyltransferase [Fermentimonas sp.]MBP7103943.1 3-methyl-2-oxobutanoate hydroxymethyltransferase [Fermentimonas sp.]MCK9501863.1 3-methyl-2-oxobutanoate hydroxymethyltransferase [Lascolabacillus sp.]
MSQQKGYLSNENRKKVTTHRLLEMKQNGEKISMLTAYDYSMASIIDKAGMDVILVGDSASNVMVGNATTLPMTVDQMIHHGKSVTNGVEKAMVVVDMPFGSYHASTQEAVTNAVRIMRETGADCLKLEGGVEIIDSVRAILATGIPIMGHLGLMPQSINKYGSYALRAKDSAEADKLISDAKLLEETGCCSVVLEKIPTELAKKVTEELNIPTIGIGAGPFVDGQVLVMHDMLGLNKGFSPKFLRRYANLYDVIIEAVQSYIEDVKSSDFPSVDESY